MAEFVNPLRESFDRYRIAADAATGRDPMWDSAGNFNLITGRFTGSQAMRIAGAGTGTLLFKDLGENLTEFLFGFSYYQDTELIGASDVFGFVFLDDTTVQCSVMFREDGAIVVRGPPGSFPSPLSWGTVIGTIRGPVSRFQTWMSFQIYLKIGSGTSGKLKIWNEAQTGDPLSVPPTWFLDNLTSQSGTHNYVNKMAIVLGNNGAGPFCRIDDLHGHTLVGDAPNNLTGDLRCVEMMPIADVSQDFTPVSNPTRMLGNAPTTSSHRTINANTLKVEGSFSPSRSAFMSYIVVNLHAGFTGHAITGLYRKTGIAPDTLVGTTSVVTNPVTGDNIFTFVPPVYIDDSIEYYFAWLADANADVSTPSITDEWSIAQPYASGLLNPFPTGLTISLVSGIAFTGWAFDDAYSFTRVTEPQEDGSTSTIESSNAGDVDQYAVRPLDFVPAYIDAVMSFAFMKKSDSGPRQGQVELKSGGTTDDSTAVELETTFGYYFKVYPKDPNTGSPWTQANAEAATVGPKVAS